MGGRHTKHRQSERKEKDDRNAHWYVVQKNTATWHWSGDDWTMEEIGRRVWLTTVYMCDKEGRYPMGGTWATDWISRKTFTHGFWVDDGGVEGELKWIGINLSHWRMSLTGTYIRRRWISPFELCESTMWTNGKNREGWTSGKIAKRSGWEWAGGPNIYSPRGNDRAQIWCGDPKQIRR